MTFLDTRNGKICPTVAALYVDERGPYMGLLGVDAWGISRDARLYAGPWPVVAHPPCARWGRMAVQAFGKVYGVLGDDGGTFAAALSAVRRWGGVLEHPEGSAAWRAHGLIEPTRGGGWIAAGDFMGWTCSVEQGHFGHRTRKATWLYACGVRSLPSLPWGPSRPAGYEPCRRKGEAFTKLGKRARSATPLLFRDVLLSLASSSLPSPPPSTHCPPAPLRAGPSLPQSHLSPEASREL